MAAEFSVGPEKRTGGKIGPISLNAPDPEISEILRISEVGQLQSPILIGDWVIVVGNKIINEKLLIKQLTF